MNCPFRLWFMAPGIPEGQGMLDSCIRAGQTCIADLFVPDPDEESRRIESWSSFIAGRACSWPTRYGLRLRCAAAHRLATTLSASRLGDLRSPGHLVLVGESRENGLAGELRALKREGLTLCWEYAPGMACPVEPALLDAIVVRGNESGGVSRDQSVRTLFDLARDEYREMPLIVQGVESPESAAVFLLLGAAGHVLDASLFNLAGRFFSGDVSREILSRREGGLRRVDAGEHWAEVCYSCVLGTGEESIPVGPGSLLAPAGQEGSNISAMAASFRQETNSALGRLVRTEPDELASLQAEPLLVQGPMAGISNSAALAGAVADAGFFPVLSLTGLDKDAVARLGSEVGGCDTISSFGLGITGHTGFGPGDLKAAFPHKPPSVVVLSADRWPFRAKWNGSPGELWLHVQTPEMLEVSLAEGYRHFILEGGESGGHVGRLSSVVLWDRLLRHIGTREIESSDIHLVLAGGVHSPESLLFGSLLAAAFGFEGTLSFQLGTPILLSREAVECGSIHAGYRQRMLGSGFTHVAGPGTGAGVRFVSHDAGQPDEREDDEAGYLAAYRRAVRSGAGLVLAGESIAHFSDPVELTELAAGLLDYRREWAHCRERAIMVDTLDFRVTRTLPLHDLAVVGMGGIFPGAGSVEEFWNNLEDNRRHIVEVPPEYWGPGDYRARDEKDEREPYEKSYSWHAGMIRDFTFSRIDCLKYNISPRSVESTDRIHLMILKAVGEAVDSAGADFVLPRRDTAVLIGNSMGGERAKLQSLRVYLPDLLAALQDIPEYDSLDPAAKESIENQFREKMFSRLPATTEDTLVGIASSTLAGRVAAYLDVFGGNFAVDAACAASLAGLAAAAEMLGSGTCACVVVGGVDSDLSIGTFINFCRLHALAHGVSRPFMVGSDGFTMGEGAGAIFLKPLDRAVADGDRIFARITGVGMSSDGRVGSMTIPSAEGQALALRRAFVQSGFDTSSIGMIEAHGTGTIVGDAVELETLHGVFDGVSPRRIALGSVKAHVGHLKSAAGMASLAKTIMALREKILPPALIDGDILPQLLAPRTPFRLLPKPEPWHRDGFVPRRAAVSAFGFGGSNVHVHLEEMDDRLRRLTQSRLLLFSGSTADEVVRRLAAFDRAVAETGAVDLNDPGQTAALGGNGRCRLAGIWDIAQPWSAMRGNLDAALAGSDSDADACYSSDAVEKKIAFLFPGQGSAVYGPFRQMIDSFAVFRHDIERYGRLLDLDLLELLWPGEEEIQADAQRLANPFLQPATTALELALARMLKTLGVIPDAVCGHSLGFYAALAAAGSLAEADALKLVQRRAACFDSLSGPEAGCMLALAADENEVTALRDEAPAEFFAANFNSPCQTVLSMRLNDLEAVESFFEGRGIECRRLPVAWGFHSPMMAPAAAAFSKHLKKITFRDPDCDLYSETTSERVPPGSLDGRCPDWLPEHVIRPVRFARMIEAMHEDGCGVTVEVGARGTLTRFVKDVAGSRDIRCHTLDSTSDDVAGHLNRVLASLYVEAGVDVDVGGYLDVFAGHLKPVRIAGAATVRSVDEAGPEAAAGSGEASSEPGSEQNFDESDSVYRKVRAIVAKNSGFEEEQITAGQLIQETLGVDSLKMVEIGLDIERTFGVGIRSSAFPRSLTVGGLARLIAEREEEPVFRQATGLHRYVVEPRVVPLPAGSCIDRNTVLLLTNSSELAATWISEGFGAASCIDECSPDGVRAAVAGLGPSPEQAGGLVYAVVAEPGDTGEEALGNVFLPAYVLGHDVLSGIAAGGSADSPSFRLITASLRPGSHAPADTLAGFSRSLQLEFPEVRCGHVTIRLDSGIDAAAGVLWREVSACDDPFAFVTCEAGKRHVDDLCREDPEGGRGVDLTDDDVVLVTGGGRGITAETILGLSDGISPHWIVSGSTDASDGSERAAEVKKTLAGLREKGCRVDYLRCDFSSLDDVRQLAGRIEERGVGLTGVIHGAGVIADSGIEKKTLQDFMRVLTVKAGAAMVLRNTLDLSGVRFWINFSSIASVAGNRGQTDYAAANAFLNAEADSLRNETAAVSILWSPWTSVGMAAGDKLRQSLEARGIPMVSPDAGVGFVRKELASGRRPVVALCGDPLALAASQDIQSPGLWAKRRVAGASVSLLSRGFDKDEPFLRDHVIKSTVVLPGVMALEFSASVVGGGRFPLCWENVVFARIVRPVHGRIKMLLNWTATGGDSAAFEGNEMPGDGGPAFSGSILWGAERPRVSAPSLPGEVVRAYAGEELYGDAGLLFSGPLFRVLGREDSTQAATVHEKCVRAALRGDTICLYREPAVRAVVPAASIDGLFQMAALSCMAKRREAFLPAGIGSLWWSGDTLDNGEIDATLWHTGTDDEGHHLFDAVISRDGKEVVIAASLKMAMLGADSGVRA